MAPVKSRRIAVLGSRSVGKSSLTVQYVENHFVESYYPTIENTFSKNIKYKGQEFATEIIDTAGQDEYSILNSKHSIGIHGYVLVYSITSKSSFEMVKIVRDKILNHTGTEWVPIVVVGNKSDLHMQRTVSAEEGKQLANEWKCAWTEASARHNENVARAFELIISEIEKQANPSPPGDGKGCVIA
ncbi:rheb GTPase Rhb1 [Schizosaccharomyces octosporus yFS286]|uniref:Rheb GTPase Rhb1 n=1 Tax=Schizosaccharomyces octosporus (strain yFS286) TaxID=483514 RepID=S9Q182_SCHOY|nr:rheb GTPase Rhb1 [Schizosaccharomyces octosporus yFS286]EPX73473.1 rheb GTPase Rhb1 [Schizosaccharomyces octosporus yFS286]